MHRARTGIAGSVKAAAAIAAVSGVTGDPAGIQVPVGTAEGTVADVIQVPVVTAEGTVADAIQVPAGTAEGPPADVIQVPAGTRVTAATGRRTAAMMTAAENRFVNAAGDTGAEGTNPGEELRIVDCRL